MLSTDSSHQRGLWIFFLAAYFMTQDETMPTLSNHVMQITSEWMTHAHTFTCLHQIITLPPVYSIICSFGFKEVLWDLLCMCVCCFWGTFIDTTYRDSCSAPEEREELESESPPSHFIYETGPGISAQTDPSRCVIGRAWPDRGYSQSFTWMTAWNSLVWKWLTEDFLPPEHDASHSQCTRTEALSHT